MRYEMDCILPRIKELILIISQNDIFNNEVRLKSNLILLELSPVLH